MFFENPGCAILKPRRVQGSSSLVASGRSCACSEPGSEKQHTKDSEEKPTAHDTGQKNRKS